MFLLEQGKFTRIQEENQVTHLFTSEYVYHPITTTVLRKQETLNPQILIWDADFRNLIRSI